MDHAVPYSFCSCEGCFQQHQQHQQHQVSYPIQPVFASSQHIYCEQLPHQQYIMHDSRPSSSGFDQDAIAQDQIFQPHQYQQYTSTVSQQSYPSHWASLPSHPGTTVPAPDTRQGLHYPAAFGYGPAIYTAPIGYAPLSAQHDHMVPPPDSYGAIASHSSPAADGEGLYHYHTDMNETLFNHPQAEDMPVSQGAETGITPYSPTDDFHISHSLPNSDASWSHVDASSPRSSLESYVEVPFPVTQAPMGTAVNNPGVTLWRNHHHRTDSDTSAEEAPPSATSFDSFEIFSMDSPEVQHAALAPKETTGNTEALGELEKSSQPSSPKAKRRHAHPTGPTSPQRTRVTKPTVTRSNGRIRARSSPKPGPNNGSGEKRGKRKGPLSAVQRKDAHEARQRGVCIRCRDLKKQCKGPDGEPCTNCLASHARFWDAPCYRGHVYQLGSYVQDWTADFARHPTLELPAGNATECLSETGVSAVQKVWITHGYGYMFPVYVREVCFRDNSYSLVSWAETTPDDETRRYNVPTANWKIHSFEKDVLTTYLHSHLGKNFPLFVRDHFQGTKFLTDMLLTANRFWMRSKDPVVESALKFLVAYNLTTAVTFVASPESTPLREGMIRDPSSAYRTQMAAPMLVNQEIKSHLARMWRDLQNEVLQGIDLLFDQAGGKGKFARTQSPRELAWPTLLIVGSLLLAVWEEMQFDARYREPDPDVVNEFCDGMVKTPVRLIIFLMTRIGARLPGLREWSTLENGSMLNHDQAACAVMSEIRDSVIEHDDYLQTRHNAEFDPNDFDSLSNKFVSQLVIQNATSAR